MKKYHCVVSYSGALAFDVKAHNEEEAEAFANTRAETLPDDEFLAQLEPQHMETQVEEI
jgi:hypothetical protein